MDIIPLNINGAFLLCQNRVKDERGFFARQFCIQEMKAVGIDFQIRQCNISWNKYKGTLRGLHYQEEPYPEIKLVSCTQGRVYDVLVDLRPESNTYMQWISNELSFESGTTLYIPPGVAHGFQTLEDNTSVYYQVSEYFRSEYYRGLRWNDPKLGIKWPECERRIINKRDASYGLL